MTTEEIDSLRVDSAQRKVTIGDHVLPPHCFPTHARVGFAPDEATDGIMLTVEVGIAYTGDDSLVARWLSKGELGFHNFDQAVRWLSDVVRPTADGDVAAALRCVLDAEPIWREPRDTNTPGREGIDPVSEVELAIRLSATVLGQDAALGQVASLVARHANKVRPRRPASMLFYGHTGVGKTATAQAVAEILPQLQEDVEWDYARYDMSEYGWSHTLFRLIGAPPGYVGYDDECLASQLAENPYQVIVFDEVEKAHPQVITGLMNLIDAGRLNNAGNEVTDARQAILIFTTNAAQDLANLAMTPAAVRNYLISEGLPRELVGRIGCLVPFPSLDSSALSEIALTTVHRVADEYGVTVTACADEYLADMLHRAQQVQIGIRGLEHLVDADLGWQFARYGGEPVSVLFTEHQTPLVVGSADA